MKRIHHQASGKSRLVRMGCILLFLCLMLSGCQKAAEEKPAETAETSHAAAPALSPEPPRSAELLHVCNEENNEFCLAASADGTRFLICQNQYPEFSLWMQNADGSDRRALYLTSTITEEDAEAVLGLRIPQRRDKGKTVGEAVSEELDRIRRQYGSLTNGLVHTFWVSPSAQNASSAGDYILLIDRAAWGSARINVHTGETVLVPMMEALMDRSGTVLFYPTSDGDNRKPGVLPPDRNVPEETDAVLPDRIAGYPLGCSLQSDGTIWMLDKQIQSVIRQDGVSHVPAELSIVHYDRDGAELRRISGGLFSETSYAPSCLWYSEQTGVGIVSTNSAPTCILWYFGPDDENLKPLIMENSPLPSLRCAEREEVFDESGFPKASAGIFYVFGLSGNGTKLLIQDVESSNLLSLDLRTLKADILMFSFQISFMFSEHPDYRGSLLFNMGWNGGEIISCSRPLMGCAIRLPFREED